MTTLDKALPATHSRTKYQVGDAMIATIAQKLIEAPFPSFASDTTPAGTQRTVIISHAALAASMLKDTEAIKEALNKHLELTYAFTISDIKMTPARDLNVTCFCVIK